MPAPIEIHLTASQRKTLQRLRATTKSRRVWARITAILLAASGVTAFTMAETLAVCPDTVTNWKRRWLQDRYAGFSDTPRPGRPPRAQARYLHLLEEAVERGPQAYGYIFTVWNAARLAAHLTRKTNVHLSPKRIRQLLHQLDFVYGRPKHTLKSRQNRRKVRRVQAQLEALKKGLWPPPLATNSGLRMKPTSISIHT